MNFPLILLSTSLFGAALAQEKCHGINFDDRYYEAEILKEGINNVNKLTIDHNDNTLYFIFDLLGGHSTTSVGYMNLETKATGTVDGIKNPNDIAVDQMYNIVYIGGADGIFRLNERKVPVQLPMEGNNVVTLFFKNHLYYTNGRKEAFRYVNGYSTALTELSGAAVDSLVIDSDSNIFFLQDDMLFRVKQGTRAINTHEKYVIHSLTTNHFGKAIASGHDGVYAYNKYKYDLERVSGMRDLKSLTFNRHNEPVYAIADKIVKLTLTGPCHD